MHIDSEDALNAIDFDKAGGLVPVVVQHARTGTVLMLAFTNRDALRTTFATGEMHYWSRSRQELWRKGATSGNTQRLVALHADCDRDSLLALVEPAGPTCHTGSWSCFEAAPTLPALADTIAARVETASASSYTARLARDRNLRLKKLGEEAVELAVACADEDEVRIAQEAADLLYHALVAGTAAGVTLDDVLRVLAERSAARATEE